MERALASARVLVWPPLLAACAVAGSLILPVTGGEVWRLRGAAFVLASGAALAFDDPCAETLAASPTALPLRRVLRLGSLVTVWGAAWTFLLGWMAVQADVGAGVVAAVTVEAAGMLAITLAVSVVAGPTGAGPALMAVLLATLLLQSDWPFLTLLAPSPDDPEWTVARVRWAALLVTGLLVVTVASRDPGR